MLMKIFFSELKSLLTSSSVLSRCTIITAEHLKKVDQPALFVSPITMSKNAGLFEVKIMTDYLGAKEWIEIKEALDCAINDFESDRCGMHLEESGKGASTVLVDFIEFRGA